MAKAKSGADSRKPWIKWYTRDWRADPPLRMCSYAARGLWADLISLMAESREYGFLLIEGVIPTHRQIAGLLGGSDKEIAKLMKELGDANVYSITGHAMPGDVFSLIPADMPDGVMLSRRMVRDKAKADADRANGKGGGNPKLSGRDNMGVNPPANPQSQKAEVDSEEPNGSSGGEPPIDLVKVLFDEGVRLLTDTGTPEAQARSLIGRWRKNHGDEATRTAIQAAYDHGAIAPVEFIAASLTRAPKAHETWDQRRIREAMEAIQ